MEPNQPQETAPLLATNTGETSVDHVASTPHEFSPPIPVAQMLVGLVFLSISIGSGVALVASFFPSVTLEAPMTQMASAAVVPVEDIFTPLLIDARSVYVYDAQTNAELFSRDGSVQLPLASITKVAMVLAVSEVLSPDSIVTISRRAVEVGGGGLTWGEEWRVRDLIDYTLITSSNTGAEALRETADPLLAQLHPGSPIEDTTVWRMNKIAQELGMNETYFLNATGLDESSTQAGALSSAHDVALLFAYALRSKRDLFLGTAQSEVPLGPSNAPEREARNTNNALSMIPGIIMGKTGTTDLAGGNLAIAFDVEPGHPAIIVVLGSGISSRYTDMEKLVNAVRTRIRGED